MKFLITILITIFSLFFVHGQTANNATTPEERADKMTAEMQEQLPLTEEQVPTIHALNLKYAHIIQTAVRDKNLSKWAKYNKYVKISKQKEAALKPLLSEAQWKNYEKMKAEAMHKAKNSLF